MVGEATGLCFTHNICNVVICAELLEHVPNTLTVLQETHRTLEKGGYLVVSVPILGIASRVLSILMNRGPGTFRSPRHLREFSYGGFGGTSNLIILAKELKNAGYRILSIHNIGFLTFLSRFKILQKYIMLFEEKISVKLPPLFGV